MKILAIESSCDETAASVIEGKGETVKVLSNVVASQIAIHQKYHGVVPEIAAREHVLNILPTVNEALKEAFPLLTRRGTEGEVGRNIDALAITTGPGLITSLMIGIETAKTLAYAWDLPIIAVNHIEGHIYSNFINTERPKAQGPMTKKGPRPKAQDKIKFPAIILTVSGGHNLLVLMKKHLSYEIIGETLDDAAGEAFDKAAKMLGLGYPGGPSIAAAAASLRHSRAGGNPFSINLPRPMINDKTFNFSFSGLKTALLYKLQKDKNWPKRVPQYAAEFQQAVIDVLIAKTIKAAKKHNAKTVMLSGGVSANQELRQQLATAVNLHFPTSNFRLPASDFTTDNAAMIAAAAYFKAKAKKFTPLSRVALAKWDWDKLRVNPNQPL